MKRSSAESAKALVSPSLAEPPEPVVVLPSPTATPEESDEESANAPFADVEETQKEESPFAASEAEEEALEGEALRARSRAFAQGF